MLTFTSSAPGRLVDGVAATGEAVTLREHHSFVQLPDGGYTSRFADPRIGVLGPDVMDFAQPVDRDVMLHYAARHRLKKKNPAAARSEPVTPIMFYVDPGMPEPIRSAVIEGAAGGTRPSRPPASSMPSGSRCSPTAPIPRTSATT